MNYKSIILSTTQGTFFEIYDFIRLGTCERSKYMNFGIDVIQDPRSLVSSVGRFSAFHADDPGSIPRVDSGFSVGNG